MWYSAVVINKFALINLQSRNIFKAVDNKSQALVSVIMPAYNEESGIYENLKETTQTLHEAGYRFEIIVVNDGSTDNTLEEVKKAANEIECLKIVNCRMNGGKGRAVKAGFRQAEGDLVVFLDADLDLHPQQIHNLISVLSEKHVDVVIGSKRHPLSRLNYPLSRKVISNIYAFVLWMLFRLPLRDTQTGLKLFKYEVLKRVFPKVVCKKYAFDLEILANAHHLGYKIAEIPVELHFRRPVNWGRIGLRDMFTAGTDTLAIFYRMYIIRYYDKIVT